MVNLQNLESWLTLALKINPGLIFIRLHGIDPAGQCTCGQVHEDEKEIGKHPAGSWTKLATGDVKTIVGWFRDNPYSNLGLACQRSGIVVVDKDPRSGGHLSITKLDEASGYSLVETVTAITGEYVIKGKVLRGSHLLYRCDPTEKFHGNLNAQGMPGIDVKHKGYIVIAPSKHFSGVNYDFEPGLALWEREIAEAPEELLAVLRQSAPKSKPKSLPTLKPSNPTPAKIVDFSELSRAAAKVDTRLIIESGLFEGERAVQIYRLTCALAHRFGTDPIASEFIERAMVSWNSERVEPPMALDGNDGLLRHVRNALDFVRQHPLEGLSGTSLAGESVRLTDTTDAAVVDWLAQFIQPEFCWNSDRKWLRYKDGVWVPRSDEHVREHLRYFLSEFLEKVMASDTSVGGVQEVRKLMSAQKLKNFEILLRGRLEVLTEVFERKLDHLNVKNGVVDLRTGELAPHDPKHYFTSITTEEYDPNARHLDWDKALEAVPLYAQKYLQVFLGQACTGRVPTEDVVLFLIGGGRNGKSTIVHVPRVILGGFATTVSDRIFSAKDGDHPTELTDLIGKRLAILEELRASELSSKRLKDVSGTARISARRIRENTITWDPTHTLVVTSNHEPNFESSDHGTWRRLVRINFPYRFVSNPLLDHERSIELGLRERVQAGLEGQHKAALNWLIQGAMKWYANGERLEPLPEELVKVNREWRANQDVLGSFLQETLEVSPGSYVAFEDVLSLFKKQYPGEFSLGSQKQFSIQLRASEFWQDLNLKSDRKRSNSKDLSRPAGYVPILPAQVTCILGLAFKRNQ